MPSRRKSRRENKNPEPDASKDASIPDASNIELRCRPEFWYRKEKLKLWCCPVYGTHYYATEENNCYYGDCTCFFDPKD